MGKWVLCTQSNYAHSKPIQTHPIDTPSIMLVVWGYGNNGTCVNNAEVLRRTWIKWNNSFV